MYKNKIFLIILILISLSCVIIPRQCFAQLSVIDSCLIKLKSQKEDTSKVNTLLVLTREHLNTTQKPDSALYFGTLAFKLANTLNYKMGIARSQLQIGASQWRLGEYDDGLKNAFYSIKLFDNILKNEFRPDTLKILKQKAFAYTVIGSIYFLQGNYNDALKIDYAALHIRNLIGEKDGIAGAYNNIALVYRKQGKFTDALKVYLKALAINEGSNNKVYEANINGNLGATYNELGNYTEAIRRHFLALKLNEQIDNKKGISSNYQNIGNIYYYLKNYKKSLEFYNKSISIYKEISDNIGLAEVYDNIGSVYSEQNNFSQSLFYHTKSLNLRKELGSESGIADSYSNIGILNYNFGNYSDALGYQIKSIEIKEKIGDNLGLAISYNAIGNSYIKLKNYQEAKKQLEKSLKISNELKSLEVVRNNYLSLSELGSETGNFENALINYKKYINIRDSINNDEISKKVLLQQMQYDFDKKETIAKVEQQKKDTIVQQQLQQQKIERNAFIAGSILLLMLIVVLINRSKLKRTVEMERMRNRLSRDLHDDIGSTLSSINILSRTAQNNLQLTDPDVSREKTKESLQKINERSQRLLDSMSDIIWNINPGNDTIEEVMSRMREYGTTILEAKKIEYNFDFPKEKLDCKLSMEVKNNMYLIFKEAVNNLAKYSGSNTANLSLTFDEKHLHLKIQDNGIGFNISEIKHRGGLKNMQHRAEEIKGVININSVVEKGTVIELSMPRYC